MSYAKLGSNSSISSTTLTVTTSGTAAAIGDLVVARVSAASTGRPTSATVTDSAGNTYTLDIESTAGSSVYCAIYRSIITTGLSIGATVTYNTPSTASSTCIDVVTTTNPTGSPLDSTPTKANTNFGTAVTSGTTASPTTTNWIGVFVCTNTNSATVTPQTLWTEDTDLLAGGAGSGFETQTILGSTTTAMQGAGTLSANATWGACVAVYKLSAGGAPTPHRLGLLGVGS